MYDIPTEDRKCGTCAHWDDKLATEMGISPLRELRPCAKGAVDNDCGFGAIVLLGPECHCRAHGEEWEPSSDYLDDHNSDINACIYCPATMTPTVQTVRVA